MGIVSALLTGPDWQPVRPGGRNAWSATLPLLALIAAACTVAGLVSIPAAQDAARVALHDLPLAAAGTLLCFALAIPAAIVRPGLPWLLPAWLAVSVGAAGGSLVAGPLTHAMLLLPFMVAGLAGAVAAAPEGLSRAAAAAGAGPLTRACLLGRAILPRAVAAMLMIFFVSVVLS